MYKVVYQVPNSSEKYTHYYKSTSISALFGWLVDNGAAVGNIVEIKKVNPNKLKDFYLCDCINAY